MFKKYLKIALNEPNQTCCVLDIQFLKISLENGESLPIINSFSPFQNIFEVISTQKSSLNFSTSSFKKWTRPRKAD